MSREFLRERESLGERLRAIVGPKNVLDRLVDLQTYEYDAYWSAPCRGAVVFVRAPPRRSRQSSRS